MSSSHASASVAATGAGAVVFSHLTVVGLGLIGGSLAMAARAHYPQLVIRGVDPDAATLQQALNQGLINQAALELPTEYATAETLDGGSGHHLVILAAHLGINETLLPTLARSVAGQPVFITDVGSCKRDIVALGQELLPTQFVGGHPMAGREKGGLASATELLFAGKRFMITPYSSAEPKSGQSAAIAAVSGFMAGLTMRPTILPPEDHDHAMAYVSHLPQLYAVLLTNLIANHQPGRLLSYHGGGIDDQLRLAASSHAMWGDVYRQNADNMRDVLDEMIDHLNRLKDELDTPGLAQWFATSNEIHQAFHAMKHQASIS
jgi:prephenate dehydrogenase